jgi:hypothetical protein
VLERFFEAAVLAEQFLDYSILLPQKAYWYLFVVSILFARLVTVPIASNEEKVNEVKSTDAYAPLESG